MSGSDALDNPVSALVLIVVSSPRITSYGAASPVTKVVREGKRQSPALEICEYFFWKSVYEIILWLL